MPRIRISGNREDLEEEGHQGSLLRILGGGAAQSPSRWQDRVAAAPRRMCQGHGEAHSQLR